MMVVCFGLYQKYQASHFFKNELSTFGVEVSEEDELVTYAWLQAQTDPLFAMPGISLIDFRVSTANLKKTTESIKSYYEPSEQAAIEQLYPLEFLSKLVELEETRRKFILSPSPELANEYTRSVSVVAEAYESYLKSFLSTLADIHPDTLSGKQIRFHSGFSSPVYIRSVYERVLTNADLMREKARLRESCLGGEGKKCEGLMVPHISTGSRENDPRVNQLPTNISEHLAFLQAFKAYPYNQWQYEKPAAVLQQASCFEQYQPAYFHLWWREGPDGSSIFKPDILNELIFYDFVNGPQARWRYAQELIARGGGPYAYQPLTTHYVCPDLATDLSKLQTLVFVDRSGGTISYDGTDEEVFEYVDEHNRLLIRYKESGVLQESDLAAYAQNLQEMLTTLHFGRLSDELGQATTIKLFETYLIIRTQSAAYEEILMSVVSNNDAVSQYAYHGTGTTLEELFYIRSMPEALLLFMNPTVSKENHSIVETYVGSLPEKVVTTYEDVSASSTESLVEQLQQTLYLDIEMGREAGNEYTTTQWFF